jgi:dTDP-4-dehydrorhamnose reductase
MRVVVTGARGRLGSDIVREFSSDCDVRPLDRQALDLTDYRAVEQRLDEIHPDVIINCAAFNDVDSAQDRVVEALGVNAFAVLALSRAAQAGGCRLIHYSTDFVFDGESDRPYTEADAPSPRSSYGLSKLLGEWFALEGPRAHVLRVESLFGHVAQRRGSLDAILSNVLEGREVPVFVDRTVSPSYTVDVAKATRALVERDVPLREFRRCDVETDRRRGRAAAGSTTAHQASDTGVRPAESASSPLLCAVEREAGSRGNCDAGLEGRAGPLPSEPELIESFAHQCGQPSGDSEA